MEHRRFLAGPEAHRPFVGSDLLARIGGLAAVGVFVDRLYDNRALCMAVAHENIAIAMMLIEHGADATTIGAGRWVIHSELAAILSRAGARVDRSGNWIQLSCTGNQGRKDDPEYVAALLRHGARVDDGRETVQMTDADARPRCTMPPKQAL